MEHTVTFGSVSGSMVASVLFGAISLFVGIAVTRLLRGREAPEGTMPYLGAPRPPAIGCGVLAAVVGLSAVWHWVWSGFYLLRIGETALALQYHVPERERTVPLRAVSEVRWDAGAKSSRVLVVRAAGREFRSTQTSTDLATARAVLDTLRGRVASDSLRTR
jgi:hypothetical protein